MGAEVGEGETVTRAPEEGLLEKARSLWSLLGPGAVMMAAGIGTSHFLLAPIWYLMIVLCVHRLPADDRPPKPLRAWAWAGLVAITVVAGTVAWLSL